MAANAEVDANIPRMIQYTRILNLILSICMIIASLLSLLTTDNATTGTSLTYLHTYLLDLLDLLTCVDFRCISLLCRCIFVFTLLF